jgi:DNA polymerase-3 subunit epsilon
MFGAMPSVPATDSGALTPGHDVPDFAALEGLARVLDSSGQYRVLKRFEPRRVYCAAQGVAVKRALFVDVESTGLDTAADAIIEFAAVPFTFDPVTGRIHEVQDGYVALEDPGCPIPPDVQELTGITDADVAGRRIDDAAVARILDDVVLVIAHNASFDRPMLERRFPAFAERHWACSHAEVPWPKLGCRGSKLDYLLFQRCAEFFHGHRADWDCMAAIHVLATPHADGSIPFKCLLESARQPTHRVWAADTPFEVKDLLRSRRYRWHAGDARRSKCWYRDCTPAELQAELEWLCQHAYAGRRTCEQLMKHVARYTARERYSSRMS